MDTYKGLSFFFLSFLTLSLDFLYLSLYDICSYELSVALVLLFDIVMKEHLAGGWQTVYCIDID